MPWCGIWGTTGFALGWILPLIGIAFMAVMFFACSRGAGCMGGRWRGSGSASGLRRDLESLKEDVRKLQRNPS